MMLCLPVCWYLDKQRRGWAGRVKGQPSNATMGPICWLEQHVRLRVGGDARLVNHTRFIGQIRNLQTCDTLKSHGRKYVCEYSPGSQSTKPHSMCCLILKVEQVFPQITPSDVRRFKAWRAIALTIPLRCKRDVSDSWSNGVTWSQIYSDEGMIWTSLASIYSPITGTHSILGLAKFQDEG